MQFSRKRNWIPLGRSSSIRDDANVSRRVDMEERNDLLTTSSEEEDMAAPDNHTMQDPIQELLTILSRFYRYLNQADNVPNGVDWCEACMGELMAGLEITIAEKWTPVKDAIIDAARVLHSYESAGNAGASVSFLRESYEILSLMVGDLIVDSVRPGVIQKWGEHYRNGIKEMNEQGIRLVEDEEGEKDSDTTREQVALSATTRAADAVSESGDEEDEAILEDARLADSMGASATQEEDTPFDLPPLLEDMDTDDNGGEPLASGDDLNVVPPFEMSDMAPNADDPAATQTEAADIETDETEEPPVEHEADTDEENASDPEDAQGLLSELDSLPLSDEDKEDSETEEEIFSAQVDSPLEPESELISEDASEATPGLEEVETSREECDNAGGDAGLLASELSCDTDLAPAMQTQGDNPIEHFMRVAHEAMSRGDIRNAKSAALEMAVVMARLEFEQAQAQLSQSEQCLVDNARAIEQARQCVAEAEAQLSRTEELLAAREGECSACRERIGMIDEELTVLNTELEDIDAQIAALQRRRDEQCHRIQNKESEREETLSTESRLQTEGESLAQDVDGLRDQVSQAQENTERHIAQRREIENEICRAREESETRRLSLQAIERTLCPDSPSPDAASSGDDVLL